MRFIRYPTNGAESLTHRSAGGASPGIPFHGAASLTNRSARWRFTRNPSHGTESLTNEALDALHQEPHPTARHPHHKDQKRGGGNQTQDGNPAPFPFGLTGGAAEPASHSLHSAVGAGIKLRPLPHDCGVAAGHRQRHRSFLLLRSHCNSRPDAYLCSAVSPVRWLTT